MYVYHTKVKIGGEADEMLKVMEQKLLRFIMNPAMIGTFIFGIINAYIYGIVALGTWFHVKMLVVSVLVVFHGLLARWRKDFMNGKNIHSEEFYRILNEVPAICMIIAIIMVIIKPF
jgi:putative membrane protein